MEVLKTGNIINLFYLGECDNCGSIIKSKLNELCPEDKYCRRGYAPCPECEKFVNFYREGSADSDSILLKLDKS